MMKRKAGVLLLTLLFLGVIGTAAAQEEDPGQPEEIEEEPPLDTDWSYVDVPLYSRGDKTFVITVGVIFPVLFIDEEGILDNKMKVMGGAGSLAFNYFLDSHLFVGGEIGGMFGGTRGENFLFIIPMGARIGYQFVMNRFEFPLSLMLGGAPQQYLEKNHLSLFLKPEASVFWRFSPSWSFGLNTAWWFVPQWSSHTAFGNFVELTLSARYHF
ncbi:MAG: hypothetical protein LBU28_01975 [Spirochaetaceae bacterium]|jgi:hypothetical protein|nr:hypothetical protein [Spirochaetaceae bacterium]